MRASRYARCLLLGTSVCASSVGAQDSERVAVQVEYVGIEGVYLGVGSDIGLSEGDTVEVFDAPTSDRPVGLLSFVSVVARRSVAVPLDGFQTAAGAVLYIAVSRVETRPEEVPIPTPSGPVARAAPAAPRPVSVSGRLALDVDLRETRASWTGDLFGTTRRRFATPTSRLSLTVRDLPGGFEARTNLRAAYRWADQPFQAPSTSVRAYELSVAKRFQAAPVEIRMGRFRNPHGDFGRYWDGGLVRLGRRSGPGLGVAAGFEPDRANEGFSTDVPKLAGFVDYAARGARWSYATDVSLHLEYPSAAPARRLVGWSQRAALGPWSVSHRFRYQTSDAVGGWELGELRVRTGLRLTDEITLRGTFDRSRPGSWAPLQPLGAPVREEASAGVSVASASFSLAGDVGRTRRMDVWGRSIAGGASVRRGVVSAYLSGRHWARSGSTSLSLAPALSVTLGPLYGRAVFGLYSTEVDPLRDPLRSYSAEAHLRYELSRTLSLSGLAGKQWGSDLGGTRVGLGLWRSF